MAQSSSGSFGRPPARPIIVPQPASSRRYASYSTPSTSRAQHMSPPARNSYATNVTPQLRDSTSLQSSTLHAQPYIVAQRIQRAQDMLSSSSNLMIVAVATNRSMAQTRRYYDRELMGHEGNGVSDLAEWPNDFTVDREDEKRLAVGMKWSAGRAKRKLRAFALNATEEARTNAGLAEARGAGKGKDRAPVLTEEMLRNATGDGVKLSSSVQVKEESDPSRKRIHRGSEMFVPMEDDAESGRTPGSARSNRSILVSDSNEEEDRSIRRQRLKGSFANRRGVARRRG